VVLVSLAKIGDDEDRIHPKRHIRALLDSGASRSLIYGGALPTIKKQLAKPTMWNTMAGTFKTKGEIVLQWTFPQFSDKKIIKDKIAILDLSESPMYDMIIGRDLLDQLNIIIDFNSNTVD
jgi:hypothetical protein